MTDDNVWFPLTQESGEEMAKFRITHAGEEKGWCTCVDPIIVRSKPPSSEGRYVGCNMGRLHCIILILCETICCPILLLCHWYARLIGTP